MPELDLQLLHLRLHQQGHQRFYLPLLHRCQVLQQRGRERAGTENRAGHLRRTARDDAPAAEERTMSKASGSKRPGGLGTCGLCRRSTPPTHQTFTDIYASRCSPQPRDNISVTQQAFKTVQQCALGEMTGGEALKTDRQSV